MYWKIQRPHAREREVGRNELSPFMPNPIEVDLRLRHTICKLVRLLVARLTHYFLRHQISMLR